MTLGEFIATLRDKNEEDRRDAEEGGFQNSRGEEGSELTLGDKEDEYGDQDSGADESDYYEDEDEDEEYYDEAELFGDEDDYDIAYEEDYEYENESAEQEDDVDHYEEETFDTDEYQGEKSVNTFEEDEDDGRHDNTGFSESDDDGSDSDSDSDSDDEDELSSRMHRNSFAEAMKSQSFHEETSVYEDLAGTMNMDGMEMVVVDINRTCKVTKGGGMFRYAVLILVGNGNGLIGYGLGKSHEVQPAMDKAHRKALKNLFYIDRYEGHTIYHDVTEYYGKTKCCEILTLCGIKNIHCKVQGSHNLANTIKGVFKALATVRSAEEIGEARGRYVEAVL
eukprot:gene22085-26612_t